MSDADASNIERIAMFVEASVTTDIRLVAVDGPSGSGKSTLAGALAARLEAPLIEIDDFVSWNDFGGWWPRFESQVVHPLLSGHDAVYQQRDWQGDEFGDRLGSWRRVSWAPIVVIEGVASSRQQIADRLACRVWVDAPADVRLERSLLRDGASHLELWRKWMSEEHAFFEADKTASRADFLVSGISRAANHATRRV